MPEYVKTTTCKKCGKTTTGRGHLCHPNKEVVSITCDFCKRETSNMRHVCRKMLSKIEYVCKRCGRMAPYDTLLCEPELIGQD